MTRTATEEAGKPLSPAQAVLLGTLTVGTLDILYAILFFRWYRDVPASGILKSIASGLFGREAFSGGAGMAALGLLLHFVIAFGVVITFYLVSRRLPVLLHHPFVVGPLYGLVVYAVMNYAVVPLSAAPLSPPSGPPMIGGLLIHALGIGLPGALFARAAQRGSER